MSRRSPVYGPLLIALAFVGLTVWTWRAWPDVLVDFGREVYVPWQLSEGPVLYRDVAYFNGPLSPLLNAALFRCCGVSITTLIVMNLTILAALCALVYVYLKRCSDRFTATLATLTLLLVFGFGHLTTMGNYNYICPYSHEMTHGIFFSLAMLALLSSWWNGRSNWAIAAAGMCAGLVFLGKAELTLAAAGGASALLVLPAAVGQVAWKRTLAAAGVLLAGAMMPVLLAVIYLASQMPLAEAAAGTAGTWRWLLTTPVAEQSFYQQAVAGFDRPLFNLWAMLKAVGGIALVTAAVVALVRYRRADSGAVKNVLLLAAAAIAAFLLRGFEFPYLLAGRALLLTTAVILGVLMVAIVQTRNDRAEFNRLAPLAAWAVVSLLLLAKLGLVPRVYHYGFVLGMPACLLLVVALVDLLPRWLETRWSGGPALRGIVAVLVVVDLLGYTLTSASSVRNKTFFVGHAHDAMAAYDPRISPQGPALAEMITYIEHELPADATFMTLPEGIMLNYLTRRANPTGITNLMPPELAVYGQAAVLHALTTRPPDYVVLVERDASEYGIGRFGSPDYGAEIMKWVRANYQVQHVVSQAAAGERFELSLFARRAKRRGSVVPNFAYGIRCGRILIPQGLKNKTQGRYR